MERCCHRPGQCYLPDKEFRYLRHRVSLMSPSRSDYIFTTLGEWVWRVVSEDSSNHFRHWSLPLLACHIHLVGLANDFDQPMRFEMSLRFHRHHDFTKQLVVELLTGERHVALPKRQQSLHNQASTYDAVDQHHFVAWLGKNASCTEDRLGKL